MMRFTISDKVFPGQLTVNSIVFVPALENNKSTEFKDAAKNITDTVSNLF